MSAVRGWPAGIQAAATITVNFDGESRDASMMPLPLWGRYSHGRYGAQAGTSNLLELFARYGVETTFFIGAWDVERYPDLVRKIASAGHEIAGYGYRHENFSALSASEQEEVLERSEYIFGEVVGTAPKGFRAPERLVTRDTRQLLASRGYAYDSSYADDHMPYVVRETGAKIVELPAHAVWSDRMYYEKHRSPAAVRQAFVDEFTGTYEAGGLFNLMIHPRGDYGSGRGTRVRAIEPMLKSALELPGVWVARANDVATWVAESESR